MTLEAKYKPKKLSDIVGNSEVKRQLRKMLDAKNQGDDKDFVVLIHGPPGLGKTAIAEVVGFELFGEDWKSYAKVIDGSAAETSGKDSVGDVIVPYMRTSSLDGRKKFLFIDEFDGFSPKGQETLRKPFVDHINNCMVILCCNDINKIIKPIQNRYHVYEISVTEEEMLEHLKFICDAEKAVVQEPLLKACVTYSEGSLRKAIQNLEEAINGRTQFDKANYDISKSILMFALNGEFTKAQSVKVQDKRYTIKQMWEEALKIDKLPDTMKGDISMAAALYDDRATRGFQDVQLTGFIAAVCKIAQSYAKV